MIYRLKLILFYSSLLTLFACGGGSYTQEELDALAIQEQIAALRKCGFPDDFVGPIPKHCFE